MSDYDTPPRFVWLTEGGDLSHHKPNDPTAVKYARADVMQDEVNRLMGDLAEARAQADGLATALRELLDLVTWPPRPSGYVSAHFPATHLDAARAALAALPKEADDA